MGGKKKSQDQTACLEKLGNKRATGANSHLELQALIAVINVFSLAAADSFLFLAAGVLTGPVIPLMDWIESSVQRVVGGSLTGTTNPMIYAHVEQERLGTELGWDIFIFHTV